jgi:hypothetical protein
VISLPPGGNSELEKFVETWGNKNAYDPRADLKKD